jgi:hypothetical protein
VGIEATGVTEVDSALISAAAVQEVHLPGLGDHLPAWAVRQSDSAEEDLGGRQVALAAVLVDLPEVFPEASVAIVKADSGQ